MEHIVPDQEIKNCLIVEDSSTQFKMGRWTPTEDKHLMSAVKKFGTQAWKLVAERVKGRSSIQCANRWKIMPKPKIKKGKWNKKEDKILLKYIDQNGTKIWKKIPGLNRNSKQCRERWFNILQPKQQFRKWRLQDDEKIIKTFVQKNGNWKQIVKEFPGISVPGLRARLYSVLKRIWKKHSEMNSITSPPVLSYEFLESFVEEAIPLVHLVHCKRGRKNELTISFQNDEEDFVQSSIHNQSLDESPQDPVEENKELLKNLHEENKEVNLDPSPFQVISSGQNKKEQIKLPNPFEQLNSEENEPKEPIPHLPPINPPQIFGTSQYKQVSPNLFQYKQNLNQSLASRVWPQQTPSPFISYIPQPYPQIMGYPGYGRVYYPQYVRQPNPTQIWMIGNRNHINILGKKPN